MIDQLRSDLKQVSNPVRARHLLRFFKTGPGQYGEGDLFLGPTVPECRAIAKKFRDLSLREVTSLLHSKYHEERLIALFILVHQFKGNPTDVYNLYLENTKFINNWDLVDTSAGHIVGAYLANRPRQILYQLAKSDSLWERRIAIISTLYFITHGESKDALQISEILLTDKHDLIHKAVGWMLREVGKRCSREVLVQFLNKHYKTMPRTMLRYSIEHFSPDIRLKYLHGEI